ncbi:putative Flagellar hook-length control protein [Candidatus Propionivibrio aalborgensis]|jgi:flagellar hook-length control protein FliK|uniref:Putative Flagellar hook-length control protein n=1 Tax=Candidatus Propionivibrio aalborgensis TaxID=1860101 RepID=A0A1A8XQV6_9RHOO|nr:flagellar hook-length control protein FliK [Candidatus Propionivibrio aalborgensis]SBT07510.1 putative Flagellar hook-length control protein [Candidatus Propionivibrio aalborgensis]
MSVTIVSTLPNQTQATAADSVAGDDNSVAGLDFASLLFGQLAPIVAEALPNAVARTPLPATEPAATDDASLIAGLVVAPQEAGLNGSVSLPDAGKIDKASTDSISALQVPLAAGANPKPEGKTGALGSESEVSQAPTVDNKPAKFAVDPLASTRAEQVVSGKTSADALPNSAMALTGNTPGIAGNLPAQSTVSLPIPTPVRDQAWAGDFSQKIMWLTTNNKHTAQLSLNPPQMGPIEVSVNLDKGNAVVSFVSANGDTRQAIESALPKLREMFATAGIELGQTNVSAQSSGQHAGGWEGGRNSSAGMADRAILVADSAGALQGRAFSVSRGNGLIDIFA